MDTALPADHSLDAAMRLHLAGRFEDAEGVYRSIIVTHPHQAAPRQWLGFLLQQGGRLDEAAGWMISALALDDTRADWHYNFGILLSLQNKPADAVQAFLNAIALDPQNYFYWTSLGSMYEKTDVADKSEQSYLRASKLDPDCPDAWYLLSALCVEQRRYPDAKRFHCLGFIAGPAGDKSRIKLAMAYHELGRVAEAIQLIDDWLAEQPDDPEALHLAVAYKGLTPPHRCPDDYVEQSFDNFASSFESTLLKLRYSGPQALSETLQGPAFSGVAFDTLDLGCGTGLNGASLKAVSARLTGVDLSQGMLDLAQQKSLYDDLVKSEISAFLACSPQRYDLIVCIDTLIYFGALDQLVQSIAHALKPGGWFIATTETLIPGTLGVREGASGSHLNLSGRYSHTSSYLRQLLQRNGFHDLNFRDLTIRMEAGMPIPGQIIRARKTV